MPHSLPRLFGLSVVATVAALGLACATNPVTGERQFTMMSEAQEIGIGQQMDPEIRREMGVYDDPALQRYVEEIGLRMARNSQRPELPWSFAVVDTPQVNAFAVPGGFIYLTRGILAYLNDEAQLAGVLGHEIGHVTARHSVEQYSRAAGSQLGLTLGAIFFPGVRPAVDAAGAGLGLLFLKYGRDAERQSDRLGAEYAAQGGWDPAGVMGMLQTLSRMGEITDRRGTPNWLATHPDPADRVEEVRPVVEQLRSGMSELPVNRDAYLRRIDGMVYGDNPREGVVRGADFLHPDLRFALRFPEGWTVQNSPTAVVANQPGTNHYVFLQLEQQPRGRTLEEVAVNSMRNAGLSVRQGGATSINGLEAWIGTFTGRVPQLGDAVARAAFIRHDRNLYRLTGLASPQGFPRVEGDIDRTLRSFRGLSRDEAGDIRPNGIAIHTVRQDQTWQSIAQGPGQGIVEASTLAVMNGFPVNEQPRAGDRIKIVVGG